MNFNGQISSRNHLLRDTRERDASCGPRSRGRNCGFRFGDNVTALLSRGFLEDGQFTLGLKLKSLHFFRVTFWNSAVYQRKRGEYRNVIVHRMRNLAVKKCPVDTPFSNTFSEKSFVTVWYPFLIWSYVGLKTAIQIAHFLKKATQIFHLGWK